MVKDERQGWALFAAMSILFLAGRHRLLLGGRLPAIRNSPRSGSIRRQHGRQGGPLRHRQFGLWAVATTDASNGSVNAMHDSYTPLGGMIPLLNIQLGEIIFGGVGSGLYGMLLIVIIAVFVAGLMVGRTPEYLGKKIEAKEVKMSMLAILMLPLWMLCFTAVGGGAPVRRVEHGKCRARTDSARFCTLFTSQTGNNGSAFAGITGNTLWYNTTGGLAMLIGRYFDHHSDDGGGRLACRQEDVPASAGTFPTHGGLFVGLAGRRHPHRRRSLLLPGARAWTDRRALCDDGGQLF